MSWPCFLTRRVVHQVWGFSRVTYCPAKKWFTQTSAVCGKMSIADELNLPDPPTKPLQPFAKFMSKGHKEYPHLSWTERIRLLSEIWNSQTQEQKKHLLNEYYEEKKQYQLKYKAYLSQLTPEQIQSIEEAVDRRKKSKERLLSKRGKKKEMERLNRPKQPENCFFLFLNTLRHDEPSTEKGDKKAFMAKAVAKWKALSEAERNVFIEKSKEITRKFEKDIAVWEERMLREGRPELVRKTTFHRYDNADNLNNALSSNGIMSSSAELHSVSESSPDSPTKPSRICSGKALPSLPNMDLSSKTITNVELTDKILCKNGRLPARVPPAVGENVVKGAPLENNGHFHSDLLHQKSSRAAASDELLDEGCEAEYLPPHVEDEILNEIELMRITTSSARPDTLS